jgi:hypothetical protein
METQQGNGQRQVGRAFVKGDSRINRAGRPKGFDQFRRLALQIAHETVTDSKGNKISVAEALLRSWVRSREPQLQKAFIEIAYGRVPEKIEGTGLENKTQLVLYYDHERPERDRLLGNENYPG